MNNIENQMRRKAYCLGLRLSKSRSRNPDANDYGLYALIDPVAGGAINAALANTFVHSWTLEDVENYLSD
jgi:uncharacterized protein (DUF697 family)